MKIRVPTVPSIARRRHRAAQYLVALLCSALLPSSGAAQNQPVHPQVEALESLFAKGASFGSSEQALVGRFGVPESRYVTEVVNRHTGAMDHRITIRWEGVDATVYRLRSDGRDLVEVLRIRQTADPLGGGVGIGRTTLDDLVRLLGEPSAVTANADERTLRYRRPLSEGGESVSFMFIESVLRQVEWAFYID